MSEWEPVLLGDIAILRNGYAFKSGDFIDEGVPVIKIKNVKPNRIVLNTLSYVSDEIAVASAKHMILNNEILITMSGNRVDGSPDSWVGKAAKFKISGRYLLNQRVSAVRAREDRVDVDFLAYNLSSWDTQLTLINQANSSGGQANISPDTVRSLEIDLPPLREQQSIARVLSSLDDKIDLLHRQNKTLEAMAETLFRQRFVEEASGDWEEGTLGDLIELNYGKALKASSRSGTGFPVIGSSGIVGYHNEPLVEGPGIVIGRKGTIGEVIYLFNEFFPIDTTYFIASKTCPAGPLHFEYFLLRTIQFENSDSAVPGLNRNLARSAELLIPPVVRIHEFNNWFDPFSRKFLKNRDQIHTLEKLRDTLLPKLMSGEVRMNYE